MDVWMNLVSYDEVKKKKVEERTTTGPYILPTALKAGVDGDTLPSSILVISLRFLVCALSATVCLATLIWRAVSYSLPCNV